MNGDLIVILLVIAAAILAVLAAKLAAFWRGFAEKTRYLCYEMDRADSYKEYRRWRGELRCHYLCLIPFVNRRNVMRLYNRIYHRADKVKKERKDSLVPLLLPSVLGIFICTVCVCGMTWAWYTASVETPTQKLTSACYEVTVKSVTESAGTEILPIENGSYPLAEGTTYTVILTASGTVKECGGYCLIQNDAGEKTYTQTFKPEESITVQFQPTVSGNYTFTGVWGSPPVDAKTVITGVPATADRMEERDPDNVPILDGAQSFDATKSEESALEAVDDTYIVQPGDTLSGIAKKYNTTSAKLAAYNHMDNPDLIKGGQILKIPPQGYVVSEPTPPQNPSTSAATDP